MTNINLQSSSTAVQQRVTHKPLDEDCLLDGELHPSIRLRLNRVRELPMTAVANLHGVERIDGREVLVWEFVEGRTVEEILPGLDADRRENLREEVLLVVQRMHALGIVHGALHARNVIVDDRGRVRLTHVSPLLHSEDEKDLAAVEKMFRLSPAARALDLSVGESEPDGGIRVRALLGAVAVLAVGIIMTASILRYLAIHP